MFTRGLQLALWLVLSPLAASGADYGVDCSFPIHSAEWRCGDLLGDRKKVYDEYMEGCRKFFFPKGQHCDHYERTRISMSVRQPQSMVNYTSTGFKKIRAPEEVMKILYDFWEKNKDNGVGEEWGTGNAYANHWSSPTTMVNIENSTLVGGGRSMQQKVWAAAKATIEEWTGMEQKPSSLYGIRVYTEGAILNPHVDRLPLVSSAIVNVAQELDEPWPLEVYDREGKAVNVTMEPGDMILYESGSLIHGRPFALKGRYFANIFIHFEPTGLPVVPGTKNDLPEVGDFFPPYLLPDSPEIPNWVQHNPHGWKKQYPTATAVDQPTIHKAAAAGDTRAVKHMLEEGNQSPHLQDHNGWQPLHEAARFGRIDTVKLLLEHGADINARTHQGKGFSPLYVATGALSGKHPAAEYLKSLGALMIGPDL